MAVDVSSSSTDGSSSVGETKKAQESIVQDIANGDSNNSGYDRYLELENELDGPAKKRLVRKRTRVLGSNVLGGHC